MNVMVTVPSEAEIGDGIVLTVTQPNGSETQVPAQYLQLERR